jgi:hypothetical protein
VSVGRNDPCPCGSGSKYKRCCLDRELEIERLVAELEGIVWDVGEAMWELDRSWWSERVADFYEGGVAAFGFAGPDPDELFEACLWFVLDCPLDDGRPPLQHLRGASPTRAVELLGRSELRAWRIETRPTRDVLTAVCPVSGERARLEMIRAPFGDPLPGAALIERSVPLGPERWALLGKAPVLAPSVQPDFECLLASLDAPRGEFWRIHGGFLARAAWAWPEEREVTVDGEIVESALVAFDVESAASAAVAFDGDPRLKRMSPDPTDDALRWKWLWPRPAECAPPAELGAVCTICKEDADPEPYLVQIHVDVARDEIWLFAPTPRRLALAERLLLDCLDPSRLDVRRRDVEAPSVIPRWQRLRWEQSAERAARLLRAGRRAA